MSLYSTLHKDTVVYDKFNQFINDTRFVTLIEDYLKSDINELHIISSSETTAIRINNSNLRIVIDPRFHPTPEYFQTKPIAVVKLNPIGLTFVDNTYHALIDRTLTDLEEILYQGQ